MSNQDKIEEYDSEPVVYCARCYSLKIKHEDAIDSDCCMECGCSDILSTSIQDWERMYENRYRKKFVVKNNDPKSSEFYRMTISQLKSWVYNSPYRENIIKTFYPRFPKGLTNIESVIVFFDRLEKDKKINELRRLLDSKK